MSELQGASSRRRFIRQVGIGVFAAVPAMKMLAAPGSAAAANPDVAECQEVTCRDTGDGCCVDYEVYSGALYDCYDNFFQHGYCYSECVLDGFRCV